MTSLKFISVCFFFMLSVVIICTVPFNNKPIYLALALVLAVIIHFFFIDLVKEQKRGHLFLAFFMLLWMGFLEWHVLLIDSDYYKSAFISINSTYNSTDVVKELKVGNTKLLSWPARDIGYTSPKEHNDSNQEENNTNDSIIDREMYLFSQYSWYISLIITIIATLTGALMYYNWQGNQKIKKEWEELRNKTLKKEAAINTAFYNIRNEVINDPNLGNGKDEEKLQDFAIKFQEWQIDNALKYAFFAREVEPDIKENGNYNREDMLNWEAARQYWELAAYYLPDKDAYDKEHKGFIYKGMGNALREIANYGRNLMPDHVIIEDKLSRSKIWEAMRVMLIYYAKALGAYEMALTSDPYNNLVINNKANLLMDINRLVEKIKTCFNNQRNELEQDFFSLWKEALSNLPINWEIIINSNKDYYSKNGLINESYELLNRIIKINGLSKMDYILHHDAWYYRNYAVACYLKVRNDRSESYKKEDLYVECIRYLERFIHCHKDGSLKAISKLEDDEDLSKYNALEEPDIQTMLDRFR